jgi:hypothetical protein
MPKTSGATVPLQIAAAWISGPAFTIGAVDGKKLPAIHSVEISEPLRPDTIGRLFCYRASDDSALK